MRGRRRFSQVYFVLFGAQAAHFLFINIYYTSHGLTGSQIGMLAALGPIVVLLTQPFWGVVSDSLRDKRIPLLLMTAVCGAGYLMLLKPEPFSRFVVVTVMMSVFYGPVIPLLDSRTASFLGPEKQQTIYGGIRLWGSWGFLAGAVVTGFACDFWEKSFILLYAFFCWAVFFQILNLPRRGVMPSQKSWKLVPQVLANKKFSLFLALSMLNWIAGSASFPFMTPFFSHEIGMSKTMIGLAFVPAIMSEAAAFWLAKKILPKVGPIGGVSLGLLFSGLRWLLFSLVEVPFWAFAVNFLHGWAFGLFHSGTLAFISRESKPELRATAQTVFMAGTMGLAGSLGALSGGYLYDAVGTRTLFQMSAVGLFACALLQWVVLRDKRKPLPMGERGA